MSTVNPTPHSMYWMSCMCVWSLQYTSQLYQNISSPITGAPRVIVFILVCVQYSNLLKLLLYMVCIVISQLHVHWQILHAVYYNRGLFWMDKYVCIVRVALNSLGLCIVFSWCDVCVTSHLHDTDNIRYRVSSNLIGWRSCDQEY